MTLTIRASSLTDYYDCSRRAATKIFWEQIHDAGYKLKVLPKMIGAAIGNGAHASLEYTLRQKLEGDSLGFNDEAEQRAIEALRESIAEGVRYDSATRTSGMAESQVLRKSKLIRTTVAPKIQPVDVELRLNATYRNVTITGKMDYREEGGLGDLKTGKFTRHNGPQYGIYGMLSETHSAPIERITEVYAKTVPLDKPQPAADFREYGVRESALFAKRILDNVIDDYEQFMTNGDRFAFRANPSSILCGPKYCPAFGTSFCKEHLNKENNND